MSMRTGSLVFFPLFFLVNGAAAQSPVALGPGCTTATYIDRDCDGYGVGAPKGPDADDGDPAVWNFSTATAKWGSLGAFLKHLGYNPARYFYLSPSGNNSTGAPNDANLPFATLAGLRARFRLGAGDIVLARSGTYAETFSLAYPSPSGAPGNPLILMAYPGERPVWSHAADLVNSVTDIANIVFDGLSFTHPNQSGVGRTFFLQGTTENITLRNIEVWGRGNGVFAFDSMRSWLIENSVFRDTRPSGTHCIYIGARQKPNENIIVRRNLMYNCGGIGIQHNGRVSNLVISENIIHSNKLSGISLIMGVHDSTVRNNLVFNNGAQGIVLYDYESTDPNIQPFDIYNNLIEHNTVWVGSESWGQGSNTADFMPLDVVNSSSQRFTFPNNTVRNNVFVSYGGPIFRVQQTFLDIRSWTVENNVFHSVRNGAVLSQLENFSTPFRTIQTIGEFEALGPKYRGNVLADPRFVSVQTSLHSDPGRFDFRLTEGSPAIGRGAASPGTRTDLTGQERGTPPSSGAYEFLQGGGPKRVFLEPDSLTRLAMYAFAGTDPAQSLSLNAAGGDVAFTAAADAASPWLSVSPTSGAAPATLQVTARTGGLNPGIHEGRIRIAGESNTIDLPVTLTLSPVGSPLITAVRSAAGGAPGVAPNTWTEITGWNLSPGTRTWLSADFENGSMPEALDGVRVTINGKNAFIGYISPTQVNVLTPPDVIDGEVSVRITGPSGAGLPFQAPARELSPGLFLHGGGPYVAAIHSDGAPVGPPAAVPNATPARPGEAISLFGGGFGLAREPIVSGSAVQTGTLFPQPEFTIGGLRAEVTFAGLVSPGLYQFNLTVPADAAEGYLPVRASHRGAETQGNALLAVQR
jgi:uncharacterized protein (TIGR03437 family)